MMDYPVEHLVVDSNALINNVLNLRFGKRVYSLGEVVKELRDKETKERLRNSLFDLEILTASPESIKKIIGLSKKTGDYPVLSLTDINVLALTLDLHIKYNGEQSVNYDVGNVKTLIERTLDEGQSVLKKDIQIPGFICPDTDGETDDDDWLDTCGEMTAQTDVEKVACMTSDFAMQNVLLHLRLNLFSVNGQRVKELRTYVLRCRSCYNLVHNMEKLFCPKCGNKNLHRVSVTIDKEGRSRIHLNEQKLQAIRGMTHTQQNIKGGKHDNCEKMFEDQRMPQNRLAKMNQDTVTDAPFSTHDVTSRSAILGIRSQFRSKGDSKNFTNPKGRKSGRRRKRFYRLEAQFMMVCDKCTTKLSKLATVHKSSSSAKKVTNENKLLTSKARFKPEKDTFKKCRICKKLCHHISAHYCQDCAYQKGICPMCGKKVLETANYRQSLV